MLEPAVLAATLEAVSDAVLIAGPDGVIYWVNAAFTTMTGYTRDEIAGKTPRLFKSGAHDDAFYGELWSTILAGRVWTGEMTNRRKDGSLYIERQTITPVEDAGGAITHFIAVKRDVTALRASDGQKLEAVGRMAASVGHDFNNLLTIINGHADLIMMEIGGRQNPLYENAAEIKSAGERAADLTRQLLAFDPKQVMQPGLLDLNEVVSEVQRILCRLIGEDIEVVTALAPDPGRVRADRGLLQQALINLAVNARDAMPEGGRLAIGTGEVELPAAEGGVEAGRYVTLTVTGTGSGMDEDTKAHLFEPFFNTKPAVRGTGLGLSTVYDVVKQSGGQVFVEGEPGKAFTFRICLPWFAAPEVTRPQTPASGTVADRDGSETVLVVEDQAEVRRLVSSALRSFGYRVLEAGNGADALALAGGHAGPIQLLLADVVMPGLSGKEVAQRLAALRPETKVLFMSGYAEEAIVHRGAIEPGAAYIAKPFTPETLAAKVREVLGPREGPRRILVVDDDAGVRTLMCTVLRNAGYGVADAVDGRQALAGVESFRPHLVLMDLVMPEQEGIETIRELSRRRPEVKIVAMSGAFAGPLLEGTVYLGAHATLAKPITAAALLETIRGLE